MTTSGQALCWGSNAFGQVGIGAADSARHLVPERVVGGLTFASLAVGGAHTCGLLADGSAYCWGSNDQGQIQAPAGGMFPVPTPVMPGQHFASISAGRNETCTITSTGTAICWGSNAAGALGNGGAAVGSPVLGGPWAQISAGQDYTCALDTAGAAFCWGGTNSYGEWGIGAATGTANRPNAVAGGHTFTSISSYFSNACAVDVAGDAWCWGLNSDGQLGDGTLTNRDVPTRVALPTGVTLRALVQDFLSACGLTPAGAVYCWGSNRYGALGSPVGLDTPVPVPRVVTGIPAIQALSVGNFTVFALTAAGDRWVWGANSFYGELGDGTLIDRSTPELAP